MLNTFFLELPQEIYRHNSMKIGYDNIVVWKIFGHSPELPCYTYGRCWSKL